MLRIFYNTEKKTNSVFNMKNSDVISKCYEDSELLGKEEQKFSYISTVLNGFTIFDQNIFIPTWANTDAKYNQLEPYNYLEETVLKKMPTYFLTILLVRQLQRVRVLKPLVMKVQL